MVSALMVGDGRDCWDFYMPCLKGLADGHGMFSLGMLLPMPILIPGLEDVS